LDLGQVMIEHQVGEFVSDVTGEPAGGPQRVGDDKPSVADEEGGGGESESLKPFQFLEPAAVDEG